MAGEVGKIPGHRSVGLPQGIGAIDQRDIVEFGSADPFGLHDPEQARIMQIALSLRREAPQLFRSRRAIAQLRNQRPGAGDHNGMVVMARTHLGDALRGEGRYAEAEPLLLAGYERFKVPNPVTKSWRDHALRSLVRLYEAEGRPGEVEKYQALLASAPPSKP